MNVISNAKTLFLVLILTIAASLAGCSQSAHSTPNANASGQNDKETEETLKEEHYVGIIGAMKEEVQLLKDHMDVSKKVKKAGMTFYAGKLKGQQIVVVRSGIGKVNAASCAQILVDRFGADALVNVGVAGGLNPKLEIGDIVISTKTVQHDMDETAKGLKPGAIPRMDKRYFEADDKLVKLAYEASKGLPEDIAVYKDIIASGDQFIADDEKKQWIIDTFGAWAVEMEGAAIGQVAYLNKIPYVVIRSISDSAGDHAEKTFKNFEKRSAKNAAYLIEHMLKEMK